jgi:predicted dehydrogenase
MTKSDRRVVKIGMIGVGGWGTVGHLSAYHESPHAEVVAVCDALADRATQVAREWGVERAYADYRELLADPAVEAVDIATPNNIHYEIAMAAIEAGKHLICEKPLALTVEHAREMTEAAERAGVRNSVNFVHRYVPSARYVKQLIDEGALGQIHHVNLTYEQGWLIDPAFPRVWRLNAAIAGTGVLGDLGSHIIDLAAWWLGAELTAVCSRLTTFVDQRPAVAPSVTQTSARDGQRPPAAELAPVDVDDESAWLATYTNGTQGVFFTSRYATARRNWQRAEIFGSEGAVVFENEVRDSVQASLGAPMARRNAWGRLPVPPALMREDGKNSMHYFPQDIATGGQTGPTFRDGLRVQEAMDAIVRSAAERCWVAVRS